MVGSINAMGKKERQSQLVILEGSPTRTDRRIPQECTQQGDSSPLAQNDSVCEGRTTVRIINLHGHSLPVILEGVDTTEGSFLRTNPLIHILIIDYCYNITSKHKR